MTIFEKVARAVSRYINKDPAASKTKIDPDNFYDETYGTWRTYLDEQLQRNAQDKIKYEDYDLMDSEIPEISVALDVMSDFVVYPDNINHGEVFKVKSKKYQKLVDKIDEVTQFQKLFHSMIREACKYGDNIEELIPNKSKTDIIDFKNVPIESVVVNMKNGVKMTDPQIRQIDSSGKEIASLKSSECLHFSLPTSRRRYAECGKGVSKIEKARLIYRQLRLMEEGILISRLSKANNNYAIIIDVGDLTGEDALNYVDKYRKRISRKKYIDPQTGRMSYKMNPLSVVEDILVPTRQGSGGNVIPLNQNTSRGTIEDVNYFQNKMIYACGVPKILIGKEEDVNAKSTSETQFVSFLRMIRNIQTWAEPDILNFYRSALAYHGVKDADDLYVEWPIFGTIDEERKWRIELMKVQIAAMLSKDMQMIDDVYIYEHYLGMDSDVWKPLVDRMDKAEDEAKAEADEDFEDAMNLSYDPNADAAFETPDDRMGKAMNKAKPVKPKKEAPKNKKELLQLLQPQISEGMHKELETIFSDPTLCKLMYEVVHLTNTKRSK